MGRSELREHIFKMVFGAEFSTAADMEGQLNLYLDQLEGVQEKERDYMFQKAKAIIEKSEIIDKMLNGSAEGWKTSRMNRVDLTIFRLAVYEMKWDDEVPVKVAINEAVELAKCFSGEGGPSFINGVLGKLAEVQENDA